MHINKSLTDNFTKAPILNCYKFIIIVELTGEGRACIPVGLTKTWDGLIKNKVCLKSRRKKKKHWLDLGSLIINYIQYIL